MRFGVLGPLEVVRDGGTVAVGGTRQRVLLAALLLSANRHVSVDQLVDRLWGARRPAAPRRSLQVCVVRLRTLLGPDTIETRPGGYRMNLPTSDLDLLRFDALLARAATADAEPAALDALRQAVGLWRGPVCAEVTSDTLRTRDAAPVTERYLLAQERRLDLELRRGAGAELVADLRALTMDHPLRERFWAQLVLALYRAGRQSDAIDSYWSVTRQLSTELGVDPGPELRDLYQAIVRADPALQAPRTDPGWTTPPGPARHRTAPGAARNTG